MAFDWGGLLNAGVNLYAATRNSNQNQSAANNYAQQVKFNPYNISAGNSGVIFNGNNAAASLSPAYQGLQGQLTGGASGLLGGYADAFKTGGINPFLQNSFDTYNQQSPGTSSLDQFTGANPLGGQFNAAAGGLLGGLGSFDSNQLANSYTQNLRDQASTGNANDAEGLAQRLFNSGRLGSTGGQNVYGQLINQQNQQDLGFQLAGKQYAGQEQSRLAGLASQFGQQGDQLNNNAFNRSASVNDMTNQRATQRFQNAMNLFGAGQTGLQNQLSGGLGLLGGSTGLDQNLLQTIQAGGYLGGASSNANATAYQQPLDAQVAGNNASGAGLMGLLNSSGLLNKAGDALGGLFSGGGASGLQSGTPGLPNFSNMNDDQIRQWMGQNYGTQPIMGGPSSSFNGAGGQAATSSGYNPPVATPAGAAPRGAPAGGFLGGTAPIASGLQNLDYASKFAGMSDPELYSALGIGQDIQSGAALGAGSGMLGAAGKVAGVAGQALGYAGAIKQAASGDVAGGAISAVGTYLPMAGAMFAATDLINKSLGVGKKQAVQQAWESAIGAKAGSVARNLVLTTLPDGRKIKAQDALALANLWSSGDQDGYKKLYDSVKSVKGY